MSRRKKTSPQSVPAPVSAPVTAQATVSVPADRLSLRLKLLLGATCLVVGVFVIIFSRGFFSRGHSAKVEDARRMLQIERPKLAIEALAKEDSAEGHYLKSVALHAIGQHKAAREQIGEAIAISPHEVKYQGYDLLLQVSDGNPDAVDALIKLYDLSPSSPGIAFFATNAFTKKKPPEVRAALRAFELGITLIDDTPEFMSNVMHFTINTLQQSAEGDDKPLHQEKLVIAERLLEKLEQVAPKDVDLLKDLLSWSVKGRLLATSEHLLNRITELSPNGTEIIEFRVKVELLLGRPEVAIAVAKQAVTENPGDVSLELLLAEATWQAPTTPEHEKILTDLVAKRPENPEFVAKLALYLGKSKRLADAVTVLNQALATTKSVESRSALLKLAVGIPLESNHVELSEQQVARYKTEFQNSKLVDYFEARILFMKKDYAAAKQKFQKVMTEQQINNAADPKLAAECMIWQQRIQQAELTNAQRAAEALKGSKPTPDKSPSAVPVEKPMEKPVIKPMEKPAIPGDKPL